MLKKIIALAALPMFVSVSASAALTDSCKEYFTSIDSYLEKVQSEPSMKEQFDMIKQQYDQSRDQISKMPETTQDQTCKQGQDLLAQVLKAAGM